ncbi:hypothetical protein P3T36_007510 [Kitasatospora sp. MAP12-15]|uniref:glycine-rich domain-containing protein n=1 Tax=unclassified Kitasatospora TaxID=2633591 RepID=UPI002474ED9C|nr:hypothetical protein [Kitasatospora sp. MAP12-44]MDH6113732.1 hypothetical protein [Kitasatospora sp. MAP12-44]
MAAPTVTRDPHTYLSPQEWEREIQLLTRDHHDWDIVMAERVFCQAVAYLITVMQSDVVGVGCGELVDEGVHQLILDTKIYREFCDRHYGKFLDHIPYIDRKADGTVMRTAEVIAAFGFAVDWPLWEKDAAKCSPCAPGQKCH